MPRGWTRRSRPSELRVRLTVMRTCEYVIEGNIDGPTVVFIHGWPDDASLWRNQIPVLGGTYRCVLVTLPNYGRRSTRIGGFDFPELISIGGDRRRPLAHGIEGGPRQRSDSRVAEGLSISRAG
jgi:pimeloyl-ACP methyl ester carboxylesterase